MATLEDLDEPTRNELALLARDLSDNPETRTQFLKLMKKARPNTPVPELEISEQIQGATKEANDRIASLEAKLAEKDMRAELERRRQALKEEGLARSDEDVAAIEALMLKDGISNHKTAAEFMRFQRESAPPTPPNYDRSFLNRDNKSVLEKFWKDPRAASREVAADAFKDIRSGKVRLA